SIKIISLFLPMFKKKKCKQNSPNMGKMSHVVSWNPSYTCINFIQPIKGYKVLSFYGKGKEQQEKLCVRKQHSKSHQNAKNSSRCTHHRHVGNSLIYRSNQLLAFVGIFSTFWVIHIAYNEFVQLTIRIIAMLIYECVKAVRVGIIEIGHCRTFDLLYLIEMHGRIEHTGP